jgi:hypothetical protein
MQHLTVGTFAKRGSGTGLFEGRRDADVDTAVPPVAAVLLPRLPS